MLLSGEYCIAIVLAPDTIAFSFAWSSFQAR
jgi:hypothetical protein